MKNLIFILLMILISVRTALAQPCQAAFTKSYDFSTNTVTFLNTSTGGATNWTWDFGDSSSSNIKNPQPHTYQKAGSYKVCLTIFDSINCYSKFCEEISLLCQINNNEIPDYIIYNEKNTVKLVPQPNLNPNKYFFWDMGDSTIYTSKSVQHTYEPNKTYTVCMTRHDEQKCIKGCHPIKISPACQIPDFIVEPISGNFIHFTDKSSTNGYTAISNWMWSFGDNTTSTLQNPNHNFNSPGQYNVCLKISDTENTCVDSLCKKVTTGTVGVVEANEPMDITIYPNPGNNIITIDVENSSEVSVSIYDMLGIIKEPALIRDINKIKIYTQSLQTGIYFIRFMVKGSSKIHYVRWMKE